MNKVILSGNLVRDPDLKKTASGKSVLNSTIAINEKRGNEDVTYFIDFICWEKQAEYVANYAKKGSRIELCGRWTQRDWTDKAGNKRRSDEVMAESISVIFPPKTDDNQGSSSAPVVETIDDLPF